MGPQVAHEHWLRPVGVVFDESCWQLRKGGEGGGVVHSESLGYCKAIDEEGLAAAHVRVKPHAVEELQPRRRLRHARCSEQPHFIVRQLGNIPWVHE